MLEGMLFPAAALLYLTAISAEHLQGGLKLWSVLVFAVALTLDATATLVVCVLKSASLVPNLHAAMGWIALGIMALHFVWALSALTAGARAKRLFHRHSPKAAMVWTVAFVSGIPGIGQTVGGLFW